MKQAIVVSVDGHAGLPFRDYKKYLERRHHAAFDNLPDPARLLAEAFARDPNLGEAFYKFENLYRETAFQAVSDPHLRVKELEADGIVAEILFPGANTKTSVPWSDYLRATYYRSRTTEARVMQWVGEKAYNRWLAEMCAAEPGRLLGLANIPIHDMPAAVQEVYWAKDNGFVGVLLPLFNYDLPEYIDNAYWEPLWSACEETGLVLALHGGNGTPELRGNFSVFMLESGFFGARPFWHLMYNGVFDRHPRLKLTFTENFIGWMVPVLRALEASFDNDKIAARHVKMKPLQKRPREYWRDNCAAGLSVQTLAEVPLYEELGYKQLMYGADFPHPEGGWGAAREWLRASWGAGGITEQNARNMLGENAIEFYRLDRPLLARLAEKHGPTMEEVLTPLNASEADLLVQRFDGYGRDLVGNFLRQPLTAQGGVMMAGYVADPQGITK